PGDVGSERLPTRVPALQRMCDSLALPANRRESPRLATKPRNHENRPALVSCFRGFVALTIVAKSGKRAMNSGGYSPSIGSPSCSLIIAALATDFAEK